MQEEAAPVMDSFGRIYSTGRRKTSVARVWIKNGSGQFLVNGLKAIDYFQPLPRQHCIEPLISSKTAGFFDVWCTVKGGGTSGTCCYMLI
jgi:small subunit ribosomal protein S9